MSNDEVISSSKAVYENFLSLNLFDKANTFLVYNHIKNEVETSLIIGEILRREKTLTYPVVIDNEMVAGLLVGEEFYQDKFGIKTPLNYKIVNDIDVAIIPLLVCDENKNRVGFGKGFYDKFLSTHPCIKIGICYDFQVVDDITPNSWDIPLDIVITDKRIIK